jgi:hypothetical protein
MYQSKNSGKWYQGERAMDEQAMDDEELSKPSPFCCERAEDFVESFPIEEMSGRDHSGDCDNYDGAPIHQWEVTEGFGYELDFRSKHDWSL